MPEIAVILNSKAGTARAAGLREKIAEVFALHGARADVRVVSRGARLRDVARALRDDGLKTIVAGGGDGTVSSVASQLVGYDVRLGVLPLGTLNHFARDLGLPMDLDGAIKVICASNPTRVDVGMVNGLTFINNSSLGLYPDMVRVREKWRRRLGKWVAMVMASLIVLTRFPFLRITADIEGIRIKRRCPLVVVGNNEYKLEPRQFTQREVLDCGCLGVYLLRDEGRAELLRLALHSLVYRLDEAASFEHYRTGEVVLTARRKSIRVALDGEVYRLKTPLHYKSVPRSLCVLVPKRPAAEGPPAPGEG